MAASYLRQIAHQASSGLPLLRPARPVGRPLETGPAFELGPPLTASLAAPLSAPSSSLPGALPTPSRASAHDIALSPATEAVAGRTDEIESTSAANAARSRPVIAAHGPAPEPSSVAQPHAARSGPGSQPSPSVEAASPAVADSLPPRRGRTGLSEPPVEFDIEPSEIVTSSSTPSPHPSPPPSGDSAPRLRPSAPTTLTEPQSAFARLEQLALRDLPDAPPVNSGSTVVPRVSAEQRSTEAPSGQAVVHIGSIEVNVTPPPTQAQPRPVGWTPAPAAPLSRGYVPAFGLRQG